MTFRIQPVPIAPKPYPFVLSYARQDARILSYIRHDEKIGAPDPKPDPHFNVFLERLNMIAMKITGNQRPGFVDENIIRPGDDWKEDLAEALGTASTLVCLYSPAYFSREHCGKEMQVFLDRRRDYIVKNSGGKKPANIIPIVWHSVTGILPQTLPSIQYRAPKLDPDKYGAWDLGDQDRIKELEKFADEIAYRVRDAIRDTPLPPSAERPRMDMVHNAFIPVTPLPEFDSPDKKKVNEGPNAVTFVYGTSADWNSWPWAPPDDHAVLYIAAAVATGKEMVPSQLTFNLADGNLAGRLAELRAKNHVVILLLDAASLDEKDLCACIREFDCEKNELFGAIVIGKDKLAPERRARLKQVLPYFAARTRPHYFLVEERESFSAIVAEALDSLQSKARGVSRATNPIDDATDFEDLPVLGGSGRLRDAS
jgi:TIR domain